MDETGARVGERRPGGRSARVRSAILESTIEALTTASYDSLRIEDVAERAGVNKTTIYRRWPTKAELVAEATSTHSAQAVPLPDTGSLEGDLKALARSIAANVGSAAGGRMAKTMVAAALTVDEVAARAAAFWAERLGTAGTIVENAIARGDLGADADPNLLVEMLMGPLYVRLLLTGEPITRRFADKVAALVAAGATSAFPGASPGH
jgi:AcrR family transcriptional regulator